MQRTMLVASPRERGCVAGIAGSVIAAPNEGGTVDGDMTTMGRSEVAAACSKALANALTLPKRALGSLASAVITTRSTSGKIARFLSRKGRGGTERCWATISVSEP